MANRKKSVIAIKENGIIKRNNNKIKNKQKKKNIKKIDKKNEK